MVKAVCSVKEYEKIEYFGKIEIVPIYQCIYYISSYDVDSLELHKLYKQRLTSEKWIEQVKGQALGKFNFDE